MKVKDIIESHLSIANKDIAFKVVPIGKNEIYYHSNSNYLTPEIKEMQIVKWLIEKKTFVMIVDQNKEFEDKKRKFWEDKISK